MCLGAGLLCVHGVTLETFSFVPRSKCVGGGEAGTIDIIDYVTTLLSMLEQG